MAEEYNDLDRLFREKLEGHSVNPSPIAWEKLQGRMAQKKKGMAWIRIAASLLFLLGLTALLWLSVRESQQELEILADEEPAPEAVQESPLVQEAPVVGEKVEEKELPVQKKPSTKKTTPNPAGLNPAGPTLAATRPTESVPPTRDSEPEQAVEVIELPPLDTELLVAEAITDTSEELVTNEVTYKVTIISNGIKATPEKETLVGEIENKIEKIGGLIGKVDQGFADLQDAKNNLFASITAKK